MASKIDWSVAIRPLLKKYKNTRHPLEYANLYQLLVMVVLSAQDSDKHINQVVPKFFKAYPNLKTLSKATTKKLLPLLAGIRNFANKADWLIDIARTIKEDKNIPLKLEELTELKGIGRKSANVIKREAGASPEGVVVDLHVVRVAPRLGIAQGTNPVKIEEQIMAVLPPRQWDAGMAMSFLGREICRPTPQCVICPMNKVCEYYRKIKSGKPAPVKKTGKAVSIKGAKANLKIMGN